MGNQLLGEYAHAQVITQSPTHGGLIPVHGGAKPVHGGLNAENPNLVLNGTGDDGAAAWSAVSGGAASANGGRIRVTTTGAANGFVSQSFVTEAGATYSIKADLINGDANTQLRIGQFVSDLSLFNSGAAGAVGTVNSTFVATDTGTVITLSAIGASAGLFADYDNIEIRKV